MKRIVLKTFILIFFLGFLGDFGNVYASDKQVQSVEVTFTSKGTPVFNSKFTIKNLQNAYDKIKSGDITSKEVNSAAWQSTEQQRGVIVSETFGINPGIEHTSQETESILRNLCNSGAIDLVDELNHNDNSTSIFHYPKNISRRYTDNKGRATATADIGINGIFDGDGNLVQLLWIKSDDSNKFVVDTDSTTDLFKGKVTNLSDSMKGNDNSYTIEFGQELTYQLTIDKSLLTQDLPIVINPQTNLVIDDISVPFTQISAYGDSVINLQTLGITADSSISPNASLAVIKSQIQKIFYKNTLWGYATTIPKSDMDVTFTIKAHLSPEVKLSGNLQGVTTDGSLLPMEFVVGDEDIDVNTNFFMKISATTSTGPLEYDMPTMRTSGINFVSVNDSGTQLKTNKNYLLGYEKNNQKYIYGDGKWNKVSNLENLDLNTFQVFSGGSQYYLGGSSLPLPTNTNSFTYDANKNRKINESLIKFVGLGQGKKYFLYSTENQTLEKKEIPFTVYSKDSLRSNGQKSTKTSIGSAEYENYSINGLIPDYQAGTTEYNAIMPKHHKSHNPLLLILIEIGGTVILIICAFAFLYKKG